VPYSLRETLDQKIMRNKMLLELKFREGLFNVKNQTSKNYRGPIFGSSLCPQVGSDQKMHNMKYSQNFIVGVYIIQKCQLTKCMFDPLLTNTFRVALGSLGDLGSKN